MMSKPTRQEPNGPASKISAQETSSSSTKQRSKSFNVKPYRWRPKVKHVGGAKNVHVGVLPKILPARSHHTRNLERLRRVLCERPPQSEKGNEPRPHKAAHTRGDSTSHNFTAMGEGPRKGWNTKIFFPRHSSTHGTRPTLSLQMHPGGWQNAILLEQWGNSPHSQEW